MNETEIDKLRERFESMIEECRSCYFEPDELETLARSYQDDMEYDRALQVINHGLMMYPDNEPLLLCKAHYLAMSGATEQARSILSSVHEHSIEYYLLLSEVELVSENVDAALTAFKNIVELPESTIEDCIDILDICADFYHIDLLSQLTEVVEARFADATPYLRELALLCMDNDREDEAIELFNKILDVNPFSADDWLLLAKAHTLHKDIDKALEACDFALAINEKDENAVSFKGYCLYDSGRLEEAIEQFETFLNLTSHKAVAYELLAETYSRMEQHENAIKYLLLAVALDEHNDDVYYQLAVNYYCMGDIDSAVKNLRQAISCNDSDREARIFLGELLMQKGEFEEAYDQLIYIDKHPITDTVEAVAYANVCIQLQRYNEALIVLQQLVEREPYNLHFLFDMILCYMQIEQYDEAAYWVEKVEKLSHDRELINSLDAASQEDWISVGERIDQLRNILKVYLDEQ